jgi:hypothetical protein
VTESLLGHVCRDVSPLLPGRAGALRGLLLLRSRGRTPGCACSLGPVILEDSAVRIGVVGVIVVLPVHVEVVSVCLQTDSIGQSEPRTL